MCRLLGLLLIFSLSTQAQTVDERAETINRLISSKSAITSDSVLQQMDDSLTGCFLQLFKTVSDISFHATQINGAGVLVSDDGKVGLITWDSRLKGGNHRYFGIVFTPHTNSDTLVPTLLHHKSNIRAVSPYQVIRDTAWYGCLYYEIVSCRSREGNYYVLLGYDYFTLFSTIKIIETLAITETGKPVFGKPVLVNNGRSQCREVFEYSEDAVMSLRYIPAKQWIVFDHLSPIRPSLEGSYQFYGPDFTYDAYSFEKGIWYYQSDVDMRTGE